eukprot:18847_5
MILTPVFRFDVENFPGLPRSTESKETILLSKNISNMIVKKDMLVGGSKVMLKFAVESTFDCGKRKINPSSLFPAKGNGIYFDRIYIRRNCSG